MLRYVLSEYFPMFRRLAFSFSSGSNSPLLTLQITIYLKTKPYIAGDFNLYIYECMCVSGTNLRYSQQKGNFFTDTVRRRINYIFKGLFNSLLNFITQAPYTLSLILKQPKV